ncbi:O-antigen ligase family protein [bacterium]|nr:O-antigen ligase family protein [bacterium]
MSKMKTATLNIPRETTAPFTGKIQYYGLMLFFVLEYVRPNNYLPQLNALHLNSLVPAVVIAVTIFSSASPGNLAVLRYRNTKLILFFVLLIVGSVITADVTLYAFDKFKTIIGYVLMYFVICRAARTEDRLKGLLKTLIFVHVAVLLLNTQLFLNPEVRSYIASGAFLGDGNDLSLSIAIAIPFCVFFIREEKKPYMKAFYILVLLVLVAGIIGTSSRGGTLALVSSVLYLWTKSDRKLVLAGALVVLAGLVVSLAPSSYTERIKTIKNYESDGSAQGRLLAWESGVRMAIDHPLLGVGAGHFPVKYGVEYRPPGYGRAELPWSTAHSIYFVILGELGFPGLFFLLYIMAYNFMRNGRIIQGLRPPRAPEDPSARNLFVSLNASLVSFAVGGAFLTAIYYPHLYILAAILSSARFVFRKPPEAQPERSRALRPGYGAAGA